ncbi:hypothetical protein DXG01_001871 [Tephrocybe rancida]|nr:hypothetical protein DXG01_001871 [Tephrocybe rancida]
MNIIETTQLSSILSYFLQSIEDKSTSIRLTAVEGTLSIVNCFNPPDLEKDARASEIETIIRGAAKDAQADIRVVGRKLFEAYKLVLPNRIDSFISPLSPTTRKYLDIKPSSSNARLEAPTHAVVSNTKDKISSSTSAITSTRGRSETAHPPTHVRSASSSTLSTDRRINSTSTKALPAARQKTEMLPPAFVPVRPSIKTVSVTRSTSAAEPQPRVVSTTLPSRAELTRTGSHHSQGLPARPNSATTSNSDAPQRVQTQPAPAVGSSGPRRVPIAAATLKVAEKTSKSQPPATARSRVVSDSGATQSEAKVPPARAVQPVAPVREKPKPVPKVRGARPPVQPMEDTARPKKVGGVTQPTLSQISRAKANAERKQPHAGPSKHHSKAASSSASSHTGEKAKFKPTRLAGTGAKGLAQLAAAIPLPPSPTHSQKYVTPDGEETVPTPSLIPVALDEDEAATLSDGPIFEEATAITPSEAPQQELATLPSDALPEEAVPPLLIVHNPQFEEEEKATDVIQNGTMTGYQDHNDFGEHLTELTGEPTTPTLISADNIFDTTAKTPISSLLSSIQRGFLFTPSSPLSPPQSYLDRGTNVQTTTIPFPFALDGSATDQEKAPQGLKPFMFGVGGEEYGLSMLGSVENLNVHK